MFMNHEGVITCSTGRSHSSIVWVSKACLPKQHYLSCSPAQQTFELVCVLWKHFVRWLSSSSDAQPLMWSENVTNWPIIKQYICWNVKLRGLWHWQVPPDKPDQHFSAPWWMCLFPALCHTDGFYHNIIIKNITALSGPVMIPNDGTRWQKAVKAFKSLLYLLWQEPTYDR